MNVFKSALKSGYESLHPTFKEIHSDNPLIKIKGDVIVKIGKGLISKIFFKISPLPPPGMYETNLTINKTENIEYWNRKFGKHSMNTIFSFEDGKLYEKLMFMKIYYKLTSENSLTFQSIKTTLFNIKLPKRICPDIYSSTHSDNTGGYFLKVLTRMPFCRIYIIYTGRLKIKY